MSSLPDLDQLIPTVHYIPIATYSAAGPPVSEQRKRQESTAL